MDVSAERLYRGQSRPLLLTSFFFLLLKDKFPVFEVALCPYGPLSRPDQGQSPHGSDQSLSPRVFGRAVDVWKFSTLYDSVGILIFPRSH